MNNAFMGFMLFVALPIILVLFIWWFSKKLPSSKSMHDGETPNLFTALKEFERSHKSLAGKAVKYGLLIALLIVVLLRAYSVFKF